MYFQALFRLFRSCGEVQSVRLRCVVRFSLLLSHIIVIASSMLCMIKSVTVMFLAFPVSVTVVWLCAYVHGPFSYYLIMLSVKWGMFCFISKRLIYFCSQLQTWNFLYELMSSSTYFCLCHLLAFSVITVRLEFAICSRCSCW